MRHQWQRLLRLRSHLRSSPHILPHSPSLSQVIPQSNLHSLSLIHSKLPPLPPNLTHPLNPSLPISRHLSSAPETQPTQESNHKIIAEIFSKTRDDVDVRKELELNNVAFTYDVVPSVLRGLESSPDVARRVFDWVKVNESERLGSKGFNQMLCVLGVNGDVDRFWEMVGVMRNRGYGMARFVHDRVVERFEMDRLVSDAEKLRAVFATGSLGGSVEKTCRRVCGLIRDDEWCDEIGRAIPALKIEFTSDLVRMVVENLEDVQRKL